MKTKDKIIFFLLFSAVLFFFIYNVRLFITPFILSIVIAYLLKPVVSFFIKKFKLSRILAVSIVLGIFLILFIVFCSLFFPLMYHQAIVLVDSIPSYLEYFSDNFYPNIVNFFAKLNIEIEHNFFDLIRNNEFFKTNEGAFGKIMVNIVSSTAFLINVLSIIFIMPILIFYLLKDWHSIINKIDSILPKKYATQVKNVFELIDKSISGFIRGQINVCLILASYYGILLGFLGLNNGIFIGVLTGILSFVPYIGYGVGISIAIIVAIFQWGLSFSDVGMVLIVYALGQIIESNFLVPNLIGKKVNLHPFWMILGIFFFGSIFGFIGILLSVPLTVISAVLIRYIFNVNYGKL
jgi:predicted PurR-regulated permease PerM